jgi:hypothetical protein
VITQEQTQGLGDVDGIALGATSAAVDLDGGGIDDRVVYAPGREG